VRNEAGNDPYPGLLHFEGGKKVTWQTFFAVFVTVFLAEIGDKTQLATMLFSSDTNANKWLVFLGASAALVLAAGIGVLVGG
jgi:putative Ca2+/H+ antiporter (TMEM165/GDT1 family)